MKKRTLVTGPGMLKKGDLISIENGQKEVQEVPVREVLMAGTEKEEILFGAKKNNYYFLIGNLMKGTSWAKIVYKLEEVPDGAQ